MGSFDDIENSGSKSVAEYNHAEPDKGVVEVGRENIYLSIRPHESYEGGHRFDPYASWSAAEERRVVRKTDIRLLGWLCIMVSRNQNFISEPGHPSLTLYHSSLVSSWIEETCPTRWRITS